MALLVKASATLRNYLDGYDPVKGVELDVGSGLTVSQVAERLGIPVDKIKIIMVNGVSKDLDCILTNRDRLGLFPPVGGG